jgi:hypothetical protein
VNDHAAMAIAIVLSVTIIALYSGPVNAMRPSQSGGLLDGGAKDSTLPVTTTVPICKTRHSAPPAVGPAFWTLEIDQSRGSRANIAISSMAGRR